MKEKKIKAKRPSPKTKTFRKDLKTSKEKAVFLGLHNLKPAAGSKKRKRILGRGSSSGHGKTSTRGSKGQTSRAGRHFYLGFEGGQSPLIRKFPKRGFTSIFKQVYQIVNLIDLKNLKEEMINPEVLYDKGLISSKDKKVKILAKGDLKKSINLQAHAFSKAAREKIINAGGKAEVI
ncbi:MAG: 50S ribosomal protein L15 [Candidatus Omnitrophota bacterium]|jgi:large subunit ribosomal protein L15|nr:MAG: 50S ribosomal protein L15 [Candidatus Omnitrophota bacterium]